MPSVLGSSEDRPNLQEFDRWQEDSAYRRSLGNGLLLVAASLVVVAGVLAGLEPAMRNHFSLIWPSASDDPWFGVSVCISAVSLFVYLALQVDEYRRVCRENERLRHESEEKSVRHWTRLFGALYVSQLVGRHTDVQSVLDGITGMCVESFSADWASMMRFDREKEELVVCSASGPEGKPDIIGRRNSLTEGLAGWAARHRRPVLLGPDTDASDYAGIVLRDPTITGSMVVPIVVRNELVGVINVSTRAMTYDEEDLRTLEVFAGNAGASIRHVEHVTWLRQMIEKLRASDPTPGVAPERESVEQAVD